MREERLNTVTEAIRWIYRSYNQAKSETINHYDRDVRHPEWTSHILSILGDPDKAMYNVAVTGSKGKGSNAILLAGMLQQLGLSVGLFTGPHLVDFLERFRVNGRAIPDEVFVRCMNLVKEATDTLALPDGQYLGPVGLLAAAASLWFQEKGTDVNIFELGRGARHDDVNRIHHQGALLSPVFLEHPLQLGPTLADVAFEKSGVITADTRFVCIHGQVDMVREAIERQVLDLRIPDIRCHYSERVETRYLGETFGVDVQNTETGLVLLYEEAAYELVLRQSEGFVRDNAIVAFDAARRIWRELKPDEAMPTVIDLSALRLPGRFDVISTNPLRVVDGTIHRTSAKYLVDWIVRKQGAGFEGPNVAIVSLPFDKDGEGVLDELARLVDWVIFTKAHNPHLHFDHRFLNVARERIERVDETPFVEDAINLVERELDGSGLLVFAGTQSFVGDVLRLYGKDTLSIWDPSD